MCHVQTGSLPEQWSAWSKVGGLDVAGNQLRGTLPAAYAHPVLEVDPYVGKVTYWDFSNNQ